MDVAVRCFILGLSLPEGFEVTPYGLYHNISNVWICRVKNDKILFYSSGLSKSRPSIGSMTFKICGVVIEEDLDYCVSQFIMTWT